MGQKVSQKTIIKGRMIQKVSVVWRILQFIGKVSKEVGEKLVKRPSR